MPVTYSNVESKSEQAGAAYLESLGTITAQIATGKSSDDKAAPIVICEASAAAEEPPFTGNYWINYAATVKSEAAVDAGGAATKPADDALIGLVFNAFQVDDLCAQLSAALPDFTCMCVKEFSQESIQNGDCWENSIRFMAYCCGSSLT